MHGRGGHLPDERERELAIAIDDVLPLHAHQRELEVLDREVNCVVQVLDPLEYHRRRLVDAAPLDRAG